MGSHKVKPLFIQRLSSLIYLENVFFVYLITVCHPLTLEFKFIQIHLNSKKLKDNQCPEVICTGHLARADQGVHIPVSLGRKWQRQSHSLH